jgi:HD-like signal output (HDOD) protein
MNCKPPEEKSLTATISPADRASRARDAVKAITTIATLPEITSRLLEAVSDPNSTPAALHRIVAQDPVLAARVLKVVNSPFYRLPGLVGSIDRAIVVLGVNAVKNIAISASMARLFHGQRLYGQFTAKDVWRHCVAVAVAARELARGMKLPLAEEAFLAGMIHDIGLVVALEQFSPELVRVCAMTDPDAGGGGGGDACTPGVKPLFFEAEREVMGVDHQEMGALLAEQWKFPRPCQLVARYHHRPMDVPAESRLLVALVHAADTMCCAAGQGFSLTAIHQRLDPTAIADLGLDADVIRRVAGELDTLVAAAADLLD